MKVIELAIVLNDKEGYYTEKFDLVALPFVPRKGEMILWNNKLYRVLDVMYSFETNEYDYNYNANPSIQSSLAHDVTYKVFLKPDNLNRH
ncbi:hypothetical protein [Paenibacillus sp. M-152]|uniref:hypothetical protein n=1 Tax=Paenibacillus sp. M-152 TaxID=2487928 RepID=UPI000F6ECE70|nr:hypothetical protein [Paenibacillus sp. M-152]AZH28019.1 hypothetical protein EGM68_04220 [Paenibacillus sp. M-152]